MSSIFDSFSQYWDLKTNRYKVEKVTEKVVFDQCIQVLNMVRTTELNRGTSQSVLESTSFTGADIEFDLYSCLDTKTGNIIGCLRSTSAADVAHLPAAIKEYKLDVIDPDLINRFQIFTRLAVIKPFRKTPAALLIMVKAFLDRLSKGDHGILMSCEPNLFKMYKRIGLRPIGQIHNSLSGGYRIPMICIPDLIYFKQISNPALPLIQKHITWNKYVSTCNWYTDLKRTSGGLLERATLYQKDDSLQNSMPLTKGLSDAGIKSFLNNAMLIKCEPNDLLIAKEDGGKYLGFVRKGSLVVKIGKQNIANLNKGDVFGEVSFILQKLRSADIIAGDSGAEVVLCSVSIVNKMKRQADKAIIWRNLASILSQKLIETNGTLVDVYKNLRH